MNQTILGVLAAVEFDPGETDNTTDVFNGVAFYLGMAACFIVPLALILGVVGLATKNEGLTKGGFIAAAVFIVIPALAVLLREVL